MNVLFIVIDQLRADCLRGALAAHVPTPNLDRFAQRSVAFARHYTVTNPCGPARASLLTGLYPEKHGALRNGDPLDGDLTNIAWEVRKLGYEPLLFGYTDTQPDPRRRRPNDPDLKSYEGVLPGFRELCEMRLETGFEWPGYLRRKGYEIPVPLDRPALYAPVGGLGGPALYAAQDSDTAYLTDRAIEALDIRRGAPWFAHLCYIRPHPPLVAPAPYHALIDPESLPPPTPRTALPDHPFFDAWFSAPAQHGLYVGFDGDCARMKPGTAALLRATYLGLLAEVDSHLGRLFDWLDASGEAEKTLVIVTADHGEMLGDYGMWGKDSVLPLAFHVPLMIAAPQTTPGICDAITESVDIAPTIIEWLGGAAPPTWDGHSLIPALMNVRRAPQRAAARISIRLDGRPGAPTRFETATGLPGLGARISATRTCWRASFEPSLPPVHWSVD